jgi:hypothetical protein
MHQSFNSGQKGSLECAPKGALKRRYTFDATIESWQTPVGSGSVSATGGKLRLSGGETIALEPSGTANVADGELVVTRTAISGAQDSGVCFRATDGANLYLILLSATNIQMHKRVGGTYSQIGVSVGFGQGNITGAAIKFMVRFKGSQFDIYVNNTYAWTYIDTTYTTGICGVRAGGTSVTDYDDIEVYG